MNILRNLPRGYPSHRFVALVPAGYGYESLPVPPNCQLHFQAVRPFHDLWRLYFDNFVLPRLCRRLKADVLFSMGNTGPLWLSPTMRYVLMLRQPHFAYPVTVLRARGMAPTFRTRLMRTYFRLNVKRVNAVITQTETIAKLLRTGFQFDCPVYTIPKVLQFGENDGRNPVRHRASKVAQDIIRRCPHDKRFLYITKYYPHKRIENACRAIGEARRRGANACLCLTIEPGDHPNAKKLLHDIDVGKYPGVFSVGRVDMVDVASVYEATDAVLSTSQLESFSATYIEAMAYQRPLAVSDLEFARDVCGDSAVYFDPENVKDIADAITSVARDAKLRAQLVEAGTRRFREIDVGWERVTRLYMEALLGAGNNEEGTLNGR